MMGHLYLIVICVLLELCPSQSQKNDVPLHEYEKDNEIREYERQNGCECVGFNECDLGEDPLDPEVTGVGVIVPKVKDFPKHGIQGPRVVIGLRGDSTVVDISKVRNPPCKNQLVVCCKTKGKQTVPPPQPRPLILPCGTRNINGAAGIEHQGLDSLATQFGEFPWTAMILQEVSGVGDNFVCGGTLIRDNVVITAAHCVHTRNLNGLKVRLGEWDAQKRTEFLAHEDYRVVDSKSHPDYYPPALYNDVALLLLERRVEMKAHINTLCLPLPEQSKLPKVNCVATGWGKTSFESNTFQNFMKKVELPFVDFEQCEIDLRKSRLGPRFRLHHSMMCAGGNGADTCTGDGGGPLACTDGITSNYYLAGVVAWGVGCNQPWPGVYADVSKAEPWLSQQIADYQIV